MTGKYKILQKKKTRFDFSILDNLKMKMGFFLVHICIIFNPVNFVGQDMELLLFCARGPRPKWPGPRLARQPRYRRLAPRWKALRCSYPAGSLVWPDEAHDFPLEKNSKISWKYKMIFSISGYKNNYTYCFQLLT